jgi:hypothetical protein
MRSRWLVVVVVASLCLNLAVVGTYFLRRAGRDRPHRFPVHRLAAEVRERLRLAREAAIPEFTVEVSKLEATDSLLWVEMRKDRPDSVRVESLCLELGRMHGRMRVLAFRQMHRELQLMPAEARTEYVQRMMRMRPGPGGAGRGMMRRMHSCPPMPQTDEPPPGPPPESGD